VRPVQKVFYKLSRTEQRREGGGCLPVGVTLGIYLGEAGRANGAGKNRAWRNRTGRNRAGTNRAEIRGQESSREQVCWDKSRRE
jgi:hypothetical protein